MGRIPKSVVKEFGQRRHKYDREAEQEKTQQSKESVFQEARCWNSQNS